LVEIKITLVMHGQINIKSPKFRLIIVTLTNYNLCVNTYVYIRVSDVDLLDGIWSTVAGSVFDAVTQELAVNGVAIRRSPADVKGCGTGVLGCGDCGLTVRHCKHTHTKNRLPKC